MNSWFSCFALVGLAFAAGCHPTEFSENASSNSTSNCGFFEGEVVAAWDNGGRTMTLRQDFNYVDPKNRRWSAPAGSVVDGASIPAAFWTFIGGPFEGQYRNASVVHDVGCNEKSASWEDVHRMFYDACVCGGVEPQTAKVLYYAVYHFGPRWEPVVETVIETRQNAQGQLVQEQVHRHCLHCTHPTPPTLDEVQQVVELIEDENPAPAELENTTPEVLRRRPRHTRIHRYGPSMEGQTRELGQQAQYRNSAEQPLAPRYNGQLTQTSDQSTLPVVSQPEKQWVSNQINNYLVAQRHTLPDEYGIERTQEGYRVALRYYERNQRNEPIGYSAHRPLVRVSSKGQVMDIR